MGPPQVRAQKPGGGCREAPGEKTPRKKKVLGSSPKFFCRWAGMRGGVPRRRQVDPSITLRAPWPGVNVPNHVNCPLGTDTPGVATRTLGWMWTKLTGDLPHTEAHLPRRRPVDAWLPHRAALAGAKCAKSRLGAAGRRRGLVRGGDCCSPACLNPLGTLTKKSVMMDRVNPNHHHRGPPWIRRPREPWGRLPLGP